MPEPLTSLGDRERFEFGGLLRKFRLAAGLSQQALAERAQMSTIGVGALERGDRRAPYRETVALLATALELSEIDRARMEVAALRRSRPRRRDAADASCKATETLPRLPPNLNSFVGRDIELTEVAALIQQHRLVTLTGAGGIGKTRTALRLGSNLLQAANKEVWFVELAQLGHASSVSSAIAMALGIEESPHRPLLQTLVATLQKTPQVVILDNCEHVIDEAAIVVDTLLRGCQSLRVLATSREPLRIAGERTYRLPSLPAPSLGTSHRMSAADVVSYGAVALFVDRANAVDNRFTLTDDNARIIADICRRLDGIPLAIELAAARVNVLSLTALRDKLDERLRVLSSSDRSALGRHRTMQALIDWSYDLLSDPERRLFQRLSIFAGGCTLGTVTAVCAALDVRANDSSGEPAFPAPNSATELEVMDLLSSLVDKSLLVADVDGYEPRYRFLESMRVYAREKLRADREDGEVARNHATTYLALAERLERTYELGEDWEWRAQAEPELENVRAALEWSLNARGDVLLGQRLVGALHQVWTNFTLVEGRRWTHAAQQSAEASTPSPVVAKLEYAEAYIATWLSQHEIAAAAGERALTRYRDLNDSLGLVRAQHLVGLSLLFLDRTAEATVLLDDALLKARSLSSRRLLSRVLQCVSLARYANGDVAGARALFSEALRVYAGSFTRALQRHAGLATKQGHWRRAARLIGFCDARRAATDQTRYPNEQYGYERLVDALAAALGEKTLHALMVEGATFDDDRAIDEAFP